MKILFGPEFTHHYLKKTISNNPFKRRIHHNMHFDGYGKIKIGNQIIKIAFEYNGYQHYKFPNLFYNTYEEFIKGQENDWFKVDLCKTNNIFLIIIPYWVKIKNFESYIIKAFEYQTGIKYNKNYFNANFLKFKTF